MSIDRLHLQLSSANHRSLTLQGDSGGVLGSLEALRACNGASTLSDWVRDTLQRLAVCLQQLAMESLSFQVKGCRRKTNFFL